jgi:hypothetical protein
VARPRLLPHLEEGDDGSTGRDSRSPCADGSALARRVHCNSDPEPTATPGLVAQGVEGMAVGAGLAWTRILGLTIAGSVSLGTPL